MFFSIIIPTYNSQKYISNAIQHILDQNFGDFEILMIDGVSTDNTVQLADSFGDARIKIISEKDDGIYDAMNKGIKHAKGEWLYFSGSDDELYDTMVLDDVYKYIIKEPGVDLLYGDVIFKQARSRHYGIMNLKRMLYENNICHQSIFYHRSTFKLTGNYNLTYNLYADWDLNIRCFMHPDIRTRYFDRIIAIYNETEGISARQVDTDMNFMDINPAYQLNNRTMELYRQFEILENNFTNRKDYKIGRIILKPFRIVKRLIEKAVKK